jgi:signal transduction histidine kinase
MEHLAQLAQSVAFKESKRGRAAAVAETLASLHGTGEGPEELSHDARNMLTALELYCDLLDEAGVLADGFRHYAGELRLVAAASRRLVEKLSAFDLPQALRAAGSAQIPDRTHPDPAAFDKADRFLWWDQVPAEPIESLATELEAKRNLLAALAGPAIEITQNIHGGALPVRLTREDLVRVLVNLVKNAVEAMPAGGRIELGLDEFHADAGGSPWLVLTIEDTGPGIPAATLEAIFTAGFTTRSLYGRRGIEGPQGIDGRRSTRRGLGLSITRSIIEAAGGRIFAANRPHGGARFEIELPVPTH